MKQFLIFIQKEFYHIFRDPWTMLILLLLPIVQMVLLGFAITGEVKDARVVVLNPSRDAASAQIIERIAASKYFQIAADVPTMQAVDNAFRRGETDLAIVFGERFGEQMQRGDASIQLIADAADPNRATTIVNYASAIVADFAASARPVGEASGGVSITPNIKMLYNPQQRGAYNFVPGVMGLILLLICAMMTSISIVREKEMGTMEVLLASPVRPLVIIVAKLAPYFALSMVNLATVLLLSVFVLHVPVAGSLAWLLVLSLVYIIASLALGMFVSNIVDTQAAAMLISGMVLMMPTMILSGLMFPIESMPKVLQWFSCIVPARWYIAGVKAIMIEGVGISHALHELSILCGMAFLLLIVSLKKFKMQL
jgi:ABC-2 type transport system permease protein